MGSLKQNEFTEEILDKIREAGPFIKKFYEYFGVSESPVLSITGLPLETTFIRPKKSEINTYIHSHAFYTSKNIKYGVPIPHVFTYPKWMFSGEATEPMDPFKAGDGSLIDQALNTNFKVKTEWISIEEGGRKKAEKWRKDFHRRYSFIPRPPKGLVLRPDEVVDHTRRGKNR